jgi:A/G-specific adenine glycosylase
VMELGALVCTATNPACGSCPVLDQCAWNRLGKPPYDGPPRKTQSYAGTDRMCRGRLLAVLRDTDGTVAKARLDGVWADSVQRERALTSLLEDGLVVQVGRRFALPG